MSRWKKKKKLFHSTIKWSWAS